MIRRRKAQGCACGHPTEAHGRRGCLVTGCNCDGMSVPPPKRSKYGAVRCVGSLGEIYDSKAERDYAAVLASRCELGLPGQHIISRWAWAPRFVLQDEPLISYRPDFIFWTLDGRPRIVDVKSKGTATARDWSLRVRLWKARYPDVPLLAVMNGQEEWQ